VPALIPVVPALIPREHQEVELRHLRWFVAVAEHASFRRAAELLHVSQPPLSRGIQALEEELGVRVLDRSRSHVALTRAGAVFLEDARKILRSADEAVERARRLGEIRGSIRVACVLPEYLRRGALADALAQFKRAHPAVSVEVTPMLVRNIVNSVASGASDLGLSFTPLEGNVDALDVEVLLHDRPVVALPGDHPAASTSARAAVDLSSLRRLALVLFPRKAMPDKYDEIIGYFGAAGPPKRVVTVGPSMRAALEKVAAGGGMSVVPEIAAREHQALGYVTRPIRGVHGIWNVVLVARPKPSAPAAMLARAFAPPGKHEREPA